MSQQEFCPIEEMFHLLSGKWSTRTLFKLSTGISRPGKLRRELPGISKKVLTQTLRRLEQQGLLTRTVFSEVPPKVEYKLTKDGEAFIEPLVAIAKWSVANKKRLKRVQTKRMAG